MRDNQRGGQGRKRPPARGKGGSGGSPRRWDGSRNFGQGNSGGTKHGGSGSVTRAVVWLAAAVFGIPGLAVASAVGYVIYGHVTG
jgi:hypothetical protein